MTMVLTIDAVNGDAVSALIAGLDREFGQGAGRGLAGHFLAAEDIDFHWDARASERWLSAYAGVDEEELELELELDRVAIVGCLADVWFTAICLVDGEGRSHGMPARRSHSSEWAARKAFGDVR